MKRILVTPGEYKVSKDRSAILETFLGSCVGVAMYDRERAIGGLLHILLPAANRNNQAATPARYAASGIPVLISEMEKQGASRQRIVGCVGRNTGAVVNEKAVLEAQHAKRSAAFWIRLQPFVVIWLQRDP